MKRRICALILVLGLATTWGCATVGGTVVGAGLGTLVGDPLMGAAVGGTAGAVVDIFGR